MKALKEILNGQEGNHILPFYWQHGNHNSLIPEQIDEIRRSGCRAVCIESRPHPDFAGETWWRDMDVILEEAKKRGMKVWILDDNHFPSGHANGILGKKYPHLKPRFLLETHLDVIGPQDGASVIFQRLLPDDRLIGVAAFRHTKDGRGFEREPIDLTNLADETTLRWDVPAGVYRICFTFVRSTGTPDYIDMLREESCHAMIEAVYEPHYAHYADEFGKTIAGFFSDEPNFNNGFFDPSQPSRGFYERTVGMPGVLLPYSEETLNMMEASLGYAPLPSLMALWFDTPQSSEMRYAYMDAITRQYARNFTAQLGDWCRAHGVEYIGHIIEDMNASARTGCSAGHYFRSLWAQDMAGMDIVLNQVIPGFAHDRCTGSFSGKEGNPDFFHYTLAKLCSSLSHINPAMKGRAMCEVFGAFGWAEGTRTMKWLMDHLLVRGVNEFVPHAFTSYIPQPDCPPHFGCGGKDPQFEGFRALMEYTNRAAHLFEGSLHIATAAVLYHAEGEWMSGNDYSNCDAITRTLTDAHIDFDILPADVVMAADMLGQKLHVNRETYSCLIVPHSAHLPAALCSKLRTLQDQGLCVLYIDGAPEEAGCAPALSCADLPDCLYRRGFYDLRVKGESGYLRHYHARKEEADLFFFFNESLTEAADTELLLPVSGKYTRLDLLNGDISSGDAAEGRLKLSLAPYGSIIYIFEAEPEIQYPPLTDWETACELHPLYRVSLASYESLDTFDPYKTTDTLFNVIAREEKPNFGGRVKYEAQFSLPAGLKGKRIRLNLGHVCECASVKVNGKDCGLRICPPYAYEITDAVTDGENMLEIVAATNLAMPLKKPNETLSSRLLIPPMGVLGPVVLEKA